MEVCLCENVTTFTVAGTLYREWSQCTLQPYIIYRFALASAARGGRVRGMRGSGVSGVTLSLSLSALACAGEEQQAGTGMAQFK
jgi:hypothetical protein